jgi:CDP-2,3-bis-(O-geranylgeranyl)-sn-glycerol synthase
MKFIFSIIWLYLPGAFANMAPIIFNRINFLSFPIDAKLFGEHKTYRGFFFGIILSVLIVYIQNNLNIQTKQINIIDYSKTNILYFGVMMGLFALLGDLIKSFIKRRLKIPPGKAFIPFDQIDWVIGTSIFLIFFIKIKIDTILFSIIILGILHVIVNIVSYKLKIRKTIS